LIITAIPPFRPRPFVYEPPELGALPILHVDEHILVLDKPAGLLTVAGKTPDLADCLEARAVAEYPSATMIHRLDKDTSGIIVLALTPQSHASIGQQFEKRQTRKSYIAHVWGQVAAPKGRVDQALICDWPNRPKQHIDPINGRQAITDWQVLDILDDYTRVQMTPKTGRTHQLRVHMSFLGHPILGDNLYAPSDALAASDRLCLHAAELSFKHPETGAEMNFESVVPF
jgi:tRNA pseudouridine32 synthase/23S rRNA pseudouridine746 synthase